SKKTAPALKAQCTDLAAAILAHWGTNPYGYGYPGQPKTDALFGLLKALEDRGLMDTYLGEVMARDVTLDPGKALAAACRQTGCHPSDPQLAALFKNMPSASLPRNVRVLEHLAEARPGKDDGWGWLCETLAQELVAALERIDLDTPHDWRLRDPDRKAILP